MQRFIKLDCLIVFEELLTLWMSVMSKHSPIIISLTKNSKCKLKLKVASKQGDDVSEKIKQYYVNQLSY